MAGRWLAALAVLAMAAKAALAQEVVAARTLRAGTVLSINDLAAAAGVPDDVAAAALAELVGLETRRAIYAGRPVHVADLGPPTLVQRNALVAMHFQRGGLGIRTTGRALEAGGKGERIRVLNLSSRRTLEAVVTGPDRVEVQP